MLLAIVALVLVGCTGSSGSNTDPGSEGNAGVVDAGGPPQSGGRVVYGLAGAVNGLNPTTDIWDTPTLQVSRTLFDTLTALDADVTPQPNVARAVVPDATFTTWTITVRSGISLQNGRPVDARVVADDLQAMKDAPLTAPMLEPVATITATTDSDVVVAMTRSWADFAYVLSTQVGVVADPGWLRDGSSTEPVGSGPFRLKSSEPLRSTIVDRNPNYWRSDTQGLQLPYLDEVEFRPIVDPGVRGAALQAGDLDLMQTSNAGQLDQYRKLGKDGTYQVFTEPASETPETFVALNTAVAPFDDPIARLALVTATDTDAYVKQVEGNLVEPAEGPFAPGSPLNRKTAYPTHDATDATKLVEQVKASHGGTFSFTLLGRADTASLVGLRYLQAQWRAIGIDAVIAPLTPDELRTRVSVGSYQAASLTDFDSPRPAGDITAWQPSTAQPIGVPALNFTRNQDAQIGVALVEAQASPGPAQQQQAYGVLQDRLAADLPYVWLFHGTAGVTASPELVSVTDYHLPDGASGLPLIRGTHPLEQIWKMAAPANSSGDRH